MTDVLGPTPGIVVLNYTGDASDGDVRSFVRRLHELLGKSDSVILGSIASTASDRSASSVSRA